MVDLLREHRTLAFGVVLGSILFLALKWAIFAVAAVALFAVAAVAWELVDGAPRDLAGLYTLNAVADP